MVVGVVLDNRGKPVCCEMWPGNTTDVKSLIPVTDRIRSRSQVGRFCVVADRGMISANTFKELEDPIASFPDNDPCGGIGYRKDPVLGFEAFISDVSLEPVGDLLRQESGLRFLPTLGGSYDCLPVFNILGAELEDFTDPHAGSGHEFEQEAVPGISGSEDDFIDHILLQDLESGRFPCPEEFS
jgi:hypothetical protein